MTAQENKWSIELVGDVDSTVITGKEDQYQTTNSLLLPTVFLNGANTERRTNKMFVQTRSNRFVRARNENNEIGIRNLVHINVVGTS